MDGTGADDDFCCGCDGLHPSAGKYIHSAGTARFDAHAQDLRVGEYREVRPCPRWLQIGCSGRVAPAPVDGSLSQPIALWLRAREIRAGWVFAQRRESLQEVIVQWIGPRDVHDMHGS